MSEGGREEVDVQRAFCFGKQHDLEALGRSQLVDLADWAEAVLAGEEAQSLVDHPRRRQNYGPKTMEQGFLRVGEGDS